jgi:hypothetical protein
MVNNELEKTWKRAVMASFEEMFWNLSGGTGRSTETSV